MTRIPLNEDQRRAVEHDAGPLAVLAGPGTGKTRVITARVAHMVEERGIDPERVLALTFSNRASEELRTRLGELVGGQTGDRIHASTFHAFGFHLLTRFGDMLGLPARAGLSDFAQQHRLMLEVIEREGVGGPLATMTWETCAREGIRRVEALRDLGLRADDASARARVWLERCESNAAGLDAADLAAERRRAEEFSEYARLYGRYDALSLERGLLSFSDLIARSTDLLASVPAARDIVRSDVRHVVVDEFQDTNRGQIELLRRLCPPEANPDLCVVGDDDQAIYAFRGADPAAFLEFSAIWEGHETIALGTNYRSTSPIVRAAEVTISRAHRRYLPDKRIEVDPSRPDAEEGSVECVRTSDLSEEGAAIASELLSARARDPDIHWGEYGVIAKKHDDLDRIAAALDVANIPRVVHREASVRDEPAVQDVLAWARLLTDPEATWAARRILARPPLRAPIERVISWERRWSVWRGRESGWGREIERGTAFASWLAEHAPEDEAARRFASWYRELAGVGAGEAGDVALYRIVSLTGAAHAELLPTERRRRCVRNVIALLRFARGAMSRVDEPGDLAALLQHVDALGEERDPFGPPPEERLSPREEGGEAFEESVGAVHLLTAHASKGLEFDTVFLPNVNPTSGYGRARERDPVLPAWVKGEEEGELTGKEEQQDEERRLFYVACTRARRRLVLLTARLKGKSSSPTHFAQELCLASSAEVEVFDAEEVLRAARESGVGPAGGGVSAGAADLGLVDPRLGALERERDALREAAAAALDAVELWGAREEGERRLGEVVDRLHVVGELARGGELPGWVASAAEETRAWSERLMEAIRRAEADTRAAHEALTSPLDAPLPLSYSKIDAYTNCPLCFYVRYVLKLPEPASSSLDVGSAVHVALERYHTSVRAAEVEGRAPPGRERLLELGREAVLELAERERRRRFSAEDEQRVRSLLENYWRDLRDPGGEILEVERRVDFPYRHNGAEHRITIKVDRLDRTRTGELRLIDFKTGRVTKRLASPAPDDLQLGIYALGLGHLLEEGEGWDVGSCPGTAEYWLLEDGSIGRVRFSELDLEKVRAKIDRAIEGMLAGRFEANPRCGGVCREILGA